jgi:hypothetical protein
LAGDAGTTCDSVDVPYERTPYPLPISLAIKAKRGVVKGATRIRLRARFCFSDA